MSPRTAQKTLLRRQNRTSILEFLFQAPPITAKAKKIHFGFPKRSRQKISLRLQAFHLGTTSDQAMLTLLQHRGYPGGDWIIYTIE
jgi:hypothetical protein